jgi:hypothetical protein
VYDTARPASLGALDAWLGRCREAIGGRAQQGVRLAFYYYYCYYYYYYFFFCNIMHKIIITHTNTVHSFFLSSCLVEIQEIWAGQPIFIFLRKFLGIFFFSSSFPFLSLTGRLSKIQSSLLLFDCALLIDCGNWVHFL